MRADGERRYSIAMRRATLLLLLVTVPLSCEFSRTNRPAKEDYFESEAIDVLDRQNLWVVTLLEIQRAGFRIDEERTNERLGVFESRWLSFPQPFRFEGKRKRVIGEIVEDPEQAGEFKVRLTAWLQRNADIENPMDLSKAIWQDEPPDMMTVKQIMYQIERHFRTPRPVLGGPGASESE
jgi:hypothetical protein